MNKSNIDTLFDKYKSQYIYYTPLFPDGAMNKEQFTKAITELISQLLKAEDETTNIDKILKFYNKILK